MKARRQWNEIFKSAKKKKKKTQKPAKCKMFFKRNILNKNETKTFSDKNIMCCQQTYT